MLNLNVSRALLVVVAAAMTGPAAAQDTARPAKVVTVALTEAEVVRTYPAIVLPSDEVELSFRVGGPVVELPIRAATSVETGDMIARIDPRDFERQIAQLESQRDQSAAQLAALRTGARTEEISALQAAVASAEAQLAQAEEQAARTRQLAERGVAAAAQLDNDEAALRVAQANLQAQREQLAIGQSGGRPEDIEAAEAGLRGLETQIQIARDQLDDATLRAPFPGIIARRYIDDFSIVQPGQPIVLLQNLQVVHLTFDVPGPDVTALSANGQGNIRNEVTFDALPGRVFDAEIVEFSVQADSATQTYRGRVAVTSPDETTILPGMVGRVISSAPGGTPRLMAPLTAVAAAADSSPFVWIVEDDDTVRSQPVTLGEASGEMVEILDGLESGTTVVSAGVNHLVEGMRVRPVTRIGG
ncbi:efflux transporter [Dinoroseobacter shibae DFL 12 = DSM 16493]|jgi:multidrug efflux pump subunit AcrA (membrane-fusion protein)|uniref:Efflux transporter n=2 Tax=Pseudomonadota TaxID=1224 RepID=A8LIF1_DINSH|nr:efflux RND transporter periplasmic adaptor subunit [Dinoroseobacter shibae]ABV93005.1 efflux transporter [Dinoroseobacter shibae DFL 12 = DSM 16493]URF47938.1 efflux RND transporter periplasmic adaptor subunit [Dinoroseobacter shibae]URF52247.1 efflux RND transporter periplasmic adaptor subunit [Dinoroseobacter shibae]